MRPRGSYTGGMGNHTYPHTIENGAGERMSFVRRVQDPSGDRLEVENLVKPGSGPPMHVHYRQEEALTVRQGRIGYQRGGETPRFGGPGETVAFGAGGGRRLWADGGEGLRWQGYGHATGNVGE